MQTRMDKQKEDSVRLHETIERIEHMEQILDELLTDLREVLDDEEESQEMTVGDMTKERIRDLEKYYSDGQWLSDYELDERGVLPPGLKRGVLAEDTLYNLLYQLKPYLKESEE